MRKLTVDVRPGEYVIARLDPNTSVPPALFDAAFVSVTRTEEELSVVCPAGRAPDGAVTEPGWRLLTVRGPLEFTLTGIMAALAGALAAAGHDVVVSVLSLPRGAAGAAQLRRLAALRHGTHPHLARIRQVVNLDPARCAVVSDRVRGPTLATVLAARGRLEPGELAGLLAGIGSALGHLHERGVVHGDVSPANVVVADDGVGMPEGIATMGRASRSGLGSQIVQTLVTNELRGTIDWAARDGGGTQVVLELKLRDGQPAR